MNDKYYINNKTNSILKNSVKKNNRDVIATIVYNELSDLIDYAHSNYMESADIWVISQNLANIHKQLYSDIPFKLKKYCFNCANNCYLPDYFTLGLSSEDGIPFILEQTTEGIFLLEKQKKQEYDDSLLETESKLTNLLTEQSNPVKYEQNIHGSILL